MVSEKKPWLVLMSETHLTSEIQNCEVNIKGYKLIRCDSHSTKTGGVAFYIKNRIRFSVVHSEVYRKNVWTLKVNIKSKVLNGNFAVLYHSPSELLVKYDEFLDYFENWCEAQVDIDLLKKTSHSERVKRIIQNVGMKQIVTKPTRVTNKSRTLIDYVITNMNNVNVNVLLDEKISDHSTIAFEVMNEVTGKANKVTKLCGYSREGFIERLTEVEWSKSIGMAIDEKADFFTDSLKMCLKDFVKVITVKQDDKVWFSPGLRDQRKETGEAYKKAYYSNDPVDWIEYNRVSKLYTFNVKRAKNNYYHEKLFYAGSDQKKVWKVLKSIINGVEETIDNIEFNGEVKSDELEVAESFNRFFIDSIREINEHDSIYFC